MERDAEHVKVRDKIIYIIRLNPMGGKRLESCFGVTETAFLLQTDKTSITSK